MLSKKSPVSKPPLFSFFFLRPRPVRSAKAVRSAPLGALEVRRDSIEAAELSDLLFETQAPRGLAFVQRPRPRSEGRLLGSLPRSGKREIRVSSPIVRIPCA